MDNQIFVKEDMSEASIYRGTGNIVEPEPLLWFQRVAIGLVKA